MSDNVPKTAEAPRTAEIIQLYDDASPELKRVLERKLGNAADAEEILQDAFEKLLRLSDRQHIRDLRRYFFTMANNMALNALQHRDVEHRYRAAQTLAHEDERHDAPGPERTALANEDLLRVQVALAALPERTRHVFLLFRSDGLSYREIAEMLGISRKGVEYHLRRAVAAVMDAMKE